MYNGVYPAYIRPYTTIKPNIQRKSEEEKQQNESSANREDLQNNNANRTYPGISSYQLPGYSGFRNQIQKSQPAKNPNAQNINVAQIVSDFRKTATAVGAPEDVNKEVFAYLDLIQAQSVKDNPNKKIIQSNLKNASQVLDGYISKTLQTQSNVVENWIDALFLQNIDYKSDPNVINEYFSLDFGTDKTEKAEESEKNAPVNNTQTAQENEIAQENSLVQTANRNYVPTDKKMRDLFINAKKSVNEKDTKTALVALKKALDYAENTDDTKMQSVIYFETADLYNKNGHYAQAVKGYKLAADLASDENLIAKSYMKTGKIYDEAGLVEPAKKHWHAAIGYAGESDNFPIQVKALANIAEVQSEIYDKKSAYLYTDLANKIAEETKDNKIKGYSYKQSSCISENFDDNAKALQYLKLSTKAYSNAQDDKNVINNLISASDIMLNVGNKQKAKALLDKAYLKAVNSDNPNLIKSIGNKIVSLSF